MRVILYSNDTVFSGSFKRIAIYILARKPQAFKPGDEWHPGAMRRPFIFVAGYPGL